MECPSLPYWLTSRVDLIDQIDTAFHQLWYGIGNLFHWFPHIWADRDYDHAYCSSILRHKLTRWAAHEEKYDHHLGSKRDARRMKICAELLKRVEEDKYAANLEKAQRLRRPNTWWEDAGHGCLQYKNDATKAEKRQLGRILSQAQRQRDEELKLCFKIMSKYYLGWWN